MKQNWKNTIIIALVCLIFIFITLSLFNINKEGLTFIKPINDNGSEGDMNQLNDNIYNVYEDISNNMFADVDASNTLFDTSGNMITQILKFIKDINTKIDKPPTLKCIADYKTQTGGNLCCGQKGTLKGTEYVCPKELPYCKSMQCGTKYGVCSTVKD